MSWKIRHEGSSRSVPVETLEEVHQGLADGVWSPEDEIQGPDETTWVPLSAHPATEDAAAEVEPPEPSHHDDETHLDMTALIDVCLVLLIFFMLLVSYTALQKRLESGLAGAAEGSNVKPLDSKQVALQMIHLKINLEQGKVVYRASIQEGGQAIDKELDPDRLEEGLKALATPERRTLLLDFADNVKHGDVVKAQDAGTGVGLKIILRMPGP